jgi:nitrogen regulatory protein P-II 1
VDLIPKVRVEVLATDTHADEILETIVVAASTGSQGDGKVWVVDVQDAVRVRTGERGDSAI